MAVRIRLLRTGRKKKPSYRIVVMDSRVRRDGRYLEKVGTYYPLNKPAEVNIDKEKVLKWLEKGAEPSKTVFNLLQKEGIALDWHLIRNQASEQVRNVEMQKFELAKKVREEKKTSAETKPEAGQKAETEKEAASPAQPEKEAVAEPVTAEEPVAETTSAKEIADEEKAAEATPEVEQKTESDAEETAEEPVPEVNEITEKAEEATTEEKAAESAEIEEEKKETE